MLPDPHSFSRPEEVQAMHLSWRATVNFSKNSIHAVATWKVKASSAKALFRLDSKDLKITRVSIENNIEAHYTLGEDHPILGQALEISLPENAETVIIEYETSQKAEALQWLQPQQTAGKKYPFLFTQSQAILARSWIPCQDSPGVRFTYDAEVIVPKELMALMSASNPQKRNEQGIYKFEMKQPIPSYLMALVVGELSFEALSERSGVYAEPSMLRKATIEFADLEKMISAAESLYGRYQWDRYDVLVLPPSFPFGGMENPRLTFATPTIITGDKSLTSLIAHELAHSWSGNLVTNATWNDFWLNEGFTVYFETRIMEKLYGTDYSEMLASLNLQELKDEIKTMTEEGNAADTKLKLHLEGRNPDEGVTSIAYNKGYFFLRSIEEKYGQDKFDQFIRDYFSAKAFRAIDTEEFIPYLKEYYALKFDIKIDDVLINSWVFSEGLPEDCPQPRADRFIKVDRAIAVWKDSNRLDADEYRKWSTHEWLHFLKNLPSSLTNEQLEILDKIGKFTHSENAEILTLWSIVAIQNKYEEAYPYIESFLIHTGRRKFLKPIYNELVRTDAGKHRAREIYKKARPNYHFVARNTIDKMLNLNN